MLQYVLEALKTFSFGIYVYLGIFRQRKHTSMTLYGIDLVIYRFSSFIWEMTLRFTHFTHFTFICFTYLQVCY